MYNDSQFTPESRQNQAPSPTHFHMLLELQHRQDALALCDVLGHPSMVALFRSLLLKAAEEYLTTPPTPPQKEYGPWLRSPAIEEGQATGELPGLATWDNGPAADDPPGETPNDPPTMQEADAVAVQLIEETQEAYAGDVGRLLEELTEETSFQVFNLPPPIPRERIAARVVALLLLVCTNQSEAAQLIAEISHTAPSDPDLLARLVQHAAVIIDAETIEDG